MAGLTTPTDRKPRGTAPIPTEMEPGVKAGSKIIQGGMVVIDSSGYATPGTATTGLICLGIANSRYVGGQTATSGALPTAGIDDNTTGTNGQILTRVLTGTFRVDNGSSTDTVLITDIGNDCFMLDDHTVARTDKGGTLSRAGKIVDVDSFGVWVCFGMAVAGAATFPQFGAMLNDVGVHQPVQCIFPANLAGTLAAGVLTVTATGALAAQDGYTPQLNDRVLLPAQTSATQNGIYVVTNPGSVGVSPVLTRAPDMATGAAIVPGQTVTVAQGTLYGGTTWCARIAAASTINTTDPKFYPECFRKTVTLVAGAYTIGAGGGNEPLFLFSTTASVVSLTRNTANTSTATTGGYAAPAASRTAGIAGTAAVLVQAQVAAGTISNADVSTIDVLITN